MEKGYCENCDKLVDYYTKEREDILEVRGKRYKYKELVGYCRECKEEVSSKVLMDENLRRMDEEYRNAEGIIKIDEINLVLCKYKIGKKPLSKLLGWGETTIIRYIDGDTPTKPYSDELYKILNDVTHMEKVLEKNKKNITERAYKTTKETITNLKNGKSENRIESDIDLVAQYIIYMAKEISPLALQKILYYAQGFYNAFFNEFLFKEDCEAWIHGPVYTSIYNRYREYGSSNIALDIDYDIEDILNEDKKSILNAIIRCFGYYNGKALEKMTHHETPWIKAREGIPNDAKSNKIIEKKEIAKYFSQIKINYDMLNVDEIKKYSNEQFNKVISMDI